MTLALAALVLPIAGCSGGTTSAIGSRLLAVTDLPAGWASVPASSSSVQVTAPCLQKLTSHQGLTYADAAFVQGVSIPNLGEVVATGTQVRQQWQALGGALARCRTATITIASSQVRATVRPVSLPRVAGRSSAYAWTFSFAGVQIGFDLVLFETGSYVGYLTYSDLGAPDAATVTALVNAAEKKLRTGSTTRIAAFSVTSAPVRVARTRLGPVAYRVVGTGQPLVLITGYGGTMEGWDRRLVDTLARHHRVVIFDNAGIGDTQAREAPLSIDARANQTSALISALGLTRPAVLGWSMGSMIAQALAVLHPAQAGRLILCASFPGNGQATRPSQQAIAALGGSQQKAMADLFPADQTGAQNSYLAAISAYPSAAGAPAAVVTAQGRAVDQWWAGSDPAGRETTRIAVPTLIADGTEDRLDPLANSHALAGLISGARLVLYPDAGHAFLFQEQAAFVPLVESFLG